jgi:hypothetical protein
VKWLTKEYTRDISLSRKISQNCVQCSLQRFEHALPLSTLCPKMVTPKHKETQMTLAEDLIIIAAQDVDF